MTSVSLSGVGTVLHRKIRFGEEYLLQVDIGHNQTVEVTVTPVWWAEDGSCGFTICKIPQPWQELMDTLDRQILQLARSS